MRTIGLLICLSAVSALAAPGDETVFELQWQKDCFRRTDQVTFDRAESFAVEPKVQNRADVKRGVLKLGPDQTHETALLWDSPAGKLYVDANRDSDLTNDPNGVLTVEGNNSYVQQFKNLELTFQNESGTHHYQIELTLYPNASYNWVHVLSGYSGSCELVGKKWTIQANDGSDTQVGRDDLLSVFLQGQEDKNRIWSANMPESVFLDGRLYDLFFEFRKGDDGFAQLWCALKERDVPTGTLQIKGQWIDQLVLGDASMLILPELTDQPVTVPAGAFTVKQFALKYSQDKPAVSIDRISKIVSVPTGGQAELVIGGPLKSSIGVVRKGRMLEFAFKLTGAGGENYSIDQITDFDRSKPPAIIVYKGDTQLASGNFAFG